METLGWWAFSRRCPNIIGSRGEARLDNMEETEASGIVVAPPTSSATGFGVRIASLGKAVYPTALLASLSIWCLALRAPLWLDETLSYWQVSGGLGKVWSRSALMPSSVGYLYTLWLAKSLLGSSEIALKIPSLIALLGAVYFLFRSARELFGEETAFLACIFFSLEGNVVFAATDARPYAFALLASTLATFAFIRWMIQFELRRAIWFGAAAASVVYFHYLFASILPAFAIYYLMARWRWIKTDLRQLAAALTSFTLLTAPLALRVGALYGTRRVHTVQQSHHPALAALDTLAPKQMLIGFLITALLAALVQRVKLPGRDSCPKILLFPLLALVPGGILFTLSTTTSAHWMIPRYLSVAAVGSALTWGLLTSHIDSRWLRQIFCVGLVTLTVYENYRSPLSRRHDLSFKPAHAFVNAIVTKDELTILVCSAFIESNYEALPADRNSENAMLSQVDYYPIHGPVRFLPMSLNEETMRIASERVLAAAQERRRFLVIAAPESYTTLAWLASYTRGTFTAQMIGKFDDIVVAEFRPLAESD